MERDNAFISTGWLITVIAAIWIINNLNDTVSSLRGALGNTNGIYTASISRPNSTRLIMDVATDTASYVEPAEVTINPKGSGEDYNTITVTRVEWPNGGYSTFQDCVLTGEDDSESCQATNGSNETYQIGLNTN